MKQKRIAKGKDHPNSRLTEEAVRFIRQNHKPGSKEFSFAALGRKFLVDPETVRDAYRKMTWRHVE